MSQAEALLNSLTQTVVDHKHEVPDSDTHFIIDPYTRQIENTAYNKTVLMRGDHNSERFTFEVPRYVDGHDMSLCNRVIVHFDNVGDSVENVYSDVAYMNDLRINPDKPDTVISSWLIRREATQIVGILSFSLQYQCVENEEVTYEWNTDSYDDIEIRKSKNNGEAAVIQYTNVLEEWRSKIFGAGDSVMTNITTEGANQVAAVQNESATQQAAIELKGSETLATIPEDYTEVYNMANEALRTKADGVVCEAEGEIVTVADASNDYIRGLNVYGKSTQVTTTGKNVLDVEENFTWSGTYSKDITIPAGTYVITWARSTPGGDNAPQIRFVSNDKWVLLGTSGGSVEMEFTRDETHIYVYSNGSSYDNSEGIKSTVMQLMVSADGGTYEPYTGGTASPNPDYPQDLISIENQTVSVYGSNLLTDYTGYKMTQRGITCEFEGDGVYHIYGTFSGTNPALQFADIALNIPIDPNAKYTLSAELVDGIPPDDYHPYLGLSSDTISHRNWMALSIDSKNQVGDIINSTMIPANTINNPTRINRFWIYAHNDTLESYTVDFRIRVWLTKSDIPMSYEPYTGQKLTLANTLHGIPVSEGGNYTDSDGQQWVCDEVDLERGVYIQRIFNKTFADFNDAINYSHDANGTSCALAVGTQLVATKGMCSHLPLTINATGNNRFNPIDGVIYFKLNGEFTFEDLKATLTEMSPTVIAILTTPIETPLTAEEIETYKTLKTNYPNTTILNNAGAMMKVKYNADTKLYIDNTSMNGAVSAVEEVLNDTY